MATTVSAPLRTRRVRANPYLISGIILLVLVFALAYVAPLFVDEARANVGAFPPRQSPTAEHWLGTDTQGRDVLTTVVIATPQTLFIGLWAGAIGVLVGTLLGLLSGYLGGWTDTIIRVLTDVFMTIPAVLILVVIATNVRSMTVEIMAAIIALLAWRLPARTIRAQTLSLRERGYIQVAKLNGVGELEVIWREVLPNLLPYIAATYVATVSWAILTTIGLEALGLGPQNELTLGMMIFWSQFYGAVLRGMWWWWVPPIVVIVTIFVGLFFTSAGMDQLVNTRLRSVE